jgi:hypothetical protein
MPQNPSLRLLNLKHCLQHSRFTLCPRFVCVCSCSNLLRPPCCSPGGHVPEIRGDVRHVLQPGRAYLCRQCSRAGAASPAWESEELHVLLLMCWSIRIGGAFELISVRDSDLCVYGMRPAWNLEGSLVAPTWLSCWMPESGGFCRRTSQSLCQQLTS